ncbi:hypothetical protein HSB1_39070 [Halogranum salarium B-1]|uniref:Uncharacterized protein n=1 Tax=Halogranum salarium B-1 TaxID=1210908 RepID=J3JDT1_9EURY|nr:hypothetical protein HSB1_39070 [Halogranum salarium B-1]
MSFFVEHSLTEMENNSLFPKEHLSRRHFFDYETRSLSGCMWIREGSTFV